MTQGDPQEAAGVHEGQVLAGKYRVEKVLGIGGMGVVVAARHIELDSRVALKFLLPDLLSNLEAVRRFAREARNAVRIQNEHVARVLDVGMLDNGAPYMVMEFLEGGDLSTWLYERGPLPIEQAVDFVLQACVAVADAHSLGIIHRDLKPANLFCIRRSDGQFIIKVLDFGISKLTDVGRASEPPGMSVTKTSTVMGSPLYMSPEQVQSAKDVDARTDLWALGVILFQLVTGAVPFEGEAFGEVAVKIAVREPASLLSYRPEAPAALEAVIRKCLEKDRQRRYSNVAELSLALLPFAPEGAKGLVARVAGILQEVGMSANPLAVPSSQPTREATLLAPETPETVSPWSASGEAKAGKKAMLGAAALVISVLVVIGGIAVFRQPSPPGPAASSVRAVAPSRPSAPPPPSTTTTAAAVETTDLEIVEPPLIASAPPPAMTHHVPSVPPPLPSARHTANIAAPATTRVAPAAPRKPDCDPPFTLDDQGLKHFKHECYPPN